MCHTLTLARPETEFPAIGRRFQGRTPAFRENEVTRVSHPRVLRYRVSQLQASQWSLLQNVRDSQEIGFLLRGERPNSANS